MRPAAAIALLVSALAAPAAADDIAAFTSSSGVAVQAAVEGGDRLVVTIVPEGGVRLNGRLGVSFEAGEGSAAWGDTLPLTVFGEGDYFLDPVLETLPLDAAGLAFSSTIAVTFGSCLPETNICVLEEAAITLVREDSGTLSVTVASLAP